MRFAAVAADEEPARGLLAAMVAELSAVYGGDITAGPSASAADFSPPGGTCLVGFDGDEAVCAGAVKRLDGETAEIKRMYVLPARRGAGHGATLLAALEDAARELGYRRVRLDTGDPGPVGLYVAAGYAPIADYNGNPFARWWGEREL